MLAESRLGIWCCKDGICFVMIHDKWELAGAIVVDNAGHFVCKCAKSEDIGYEMAIYVVDEVEARGLGRHARPGQASEGQG